MARTARKSKDAGLWRWRPLTAILLTLAIVAGILFALDQLGLEALRRVGPRERYRVEFADIRCAAPPGMDRQTFLAEVRYLSGFPRSFNTHDQSNRDRLGFAFGAHPWVECVHEFVLEPGNIVTVPLTFRVPVLAVRVERGSVRLVDGHGILLPASAAPPGTAELLNTIPTPSTPAGKAWDNETVKRAIELVNAYHPKTLERKSKEWLLIQPDGGIMHVPSQ
jgi:hypothetical protein